MIGQVPPKHVRARDHLAGRIARQEAGYRPGDQLPPIRAIAAELGVSPTVAGEAVRLLAAEQLVRVRGRRLGVIVLGPEDKAEILPPRLIFGPQERWGWDGPVGGEHAEVITAETGMADARGPHEYVAGILRLEAAPPHGIVPVYRRTQFIRDPRGRPVRLEVSWFGGGWVDRVRDETGGWPLASTTAALPSFGGVARLIARAAGQPVLAGSHGVEARPARDDGRETTLLELDEDAYVLAGVYDWQAPDPDDKDEPGALRIIEYGEYVELPGRVVQFRYAVAS